MISAAWRIATSTKSKYQEVVLHRTMSPGCEDALTTVGWDNAVHAQVFHQLSVVIE